MLNYGERNGSRCCNAGNSDVSLISYLKSNEQCSRKLYKLYKNEKFMADLLGVAVNGFHGFAFCRGRVREREEEKFSLALERIFIVVDLCCRNLYFLHKKHHNSWKEFKETMFL